MRRLKNNSKKWLKTLLLFSAIFALAHYVSNNWYQFMLIQGDSMSPTYHNMQLVFLNRHDKEFTYGDVIAFQCEGLSAVLVKRIVACPGDKVIIENGTLFVNGKISSIYPDSGMFDYAGTLSEVVQLDKGQYIVIGDNIAESKDSRYLEVGCIAKNDIWGTVLGSRIPEINVYEDKERKTHFTDEE